jgi:hypothetical protein
MAAAAAALGPGAARGAPPAGDYPWRVGAASADITPPLEVGILMSSGRRQWAPFEGVRLPLAARAVLIEDAAKQRVALVSLDLLGLAGQSVGGMQSFKEQVAAAAGRTIRPEDLILASTHTHSGPESIALTELDQTAAFQKWARLLAERIGSAVQRAAGAMRPARLMTGAGDAPGLGLNRRLESDRGIIRPNRPVPPGCHVIGPEGPNDDSLRVAAFMDRGGRPIAILVNATAHPVYEMCIKQVSPDYPGELCLELGRRHPGTVAMFLQGACGNINPPGVSTGAADARRHAQRLADTVERVLGGLRVAAGPRLAIARRQLALPARTVKGQPQAEPIRAPIAAVRVGDAAFVFLPGEPFVEIGLAIRAASPWKFTIVAGYAEDYIGYIPTDRAFHNGGYETGPGAWSRVAPGSEGIVRRSAVELLAGLHEGK